MRVASGTTNQVLPFVAVDATDLKTRETGLTGFTVYRSRNGGAATAWTTPTITELSSSNMPGVYGLLLDEDTTITSGADEETAVLHITCAGMDPVTVTYELFRPKITAGNTLDVTATGAGGIDWGNVENPTTSLNLSATSVQTATNVETDTQDIQARLPAALVSGRIDASVGAMAAAVVTAAAVATGAIDADAIAADAVTEIQAGLATASALSTVAGYLDTEIAAIKAVTDLLPNGGALTSLATAANLATVAGYIDTEVASILAAVDTEVAAIKAVTDLLPNGGALTSLATAANLATLQAAVDVVDGIVDAILVDTGTTLDGRIPAALVSGRMDCSVGAVAANAITAAAVADGAIDAASLATDAGNKIADQVLRRSLATALSSANGDTKAFRSLAGAVSKLVNRVAVASGTLSVYETDDATVLGTQAVTADANANPITAVDTN